MAVNDILNPFSTFRIVNQTTCNFVVESAARSTALSTTKLQVNEFVILSLRAFLCLLPAPMPIHPGS
jgi:hypothetical protein